MFENIVVCKIIFVNILPKAPANTFLGIFLVVNISQLSRYSCRCFLRLSSWDGLVYPLMLVTCHDDVGLQYVELQHHCLPFPPWPFIFQVVLAGEYIYPEWLPFSVGNTQNYHRLCG